MKKLLLIALAGICLAAVSCQKNDIILQAGSPLHVKDAENITKFFEAHARRQESFTIDAATGGTITTSKGTKVIFPSNMFKTPTGKTVAGSVTVKVLDVFETEDMILNNKPTITTAGEQLISYGEIKVDAMQDGNALLLNTESHSPAQVIFPVGTQQSRNGAAHRDADNTRQIPLWIGIEPEKETRNISGHDHENREITVAQTFYTYPGISWESLKGMGAATATQTSFFLDSLGTWRNCDVLVKDERAKTTVLCYLGDYFNNETTTNYAGTEPSAVYFKLKNENTLIKLYNVILNPVAGRQGFLSYQNSMPIGAQGSFLAISALNGRFYAQVKAVTIGSPESGKNYFGIHFNLTEVTEQQLLALINDMKNR